MEAGTTTHTTTLLPLYTTQIPSLALSSTNLSLSFSFSFSFSVPKYIKVKTDSDDHGPCVPHQQCPNDLPISKSYSVLFFCTEAGLYLSHNSSNIERMTGRMNPGLRNSWLGGNTQLETHQNISRFSRDEQATFHMCFWKNPLKSLPLEGNGQKETKEALIPCPLPFRCRPSQVF